MKALLRRLRYLEPKTPHTKECSAFIGSQWIKTLPGATKLSSIAHSCVRVHTRVNDFCVGTIACHGTHEWSACATHTPTDKVTMGQHSRTRCDWLSSRM